MRMPLAIYTSQIATCNGDLRSSSRIAGEAAAEARIEEFVGLVDRVEREVAGCAIFGCGIKCTTHEAIITCGIKRDFTEVARDIENLVGRRDIALQIGPIGPAIAKKSRCRWQKSILIARCSRIEIERRTEVTTLGCCKGSIAGRRCSWIIAPRTRQRCSTSRLPVGE